MGAYNLEIWISQQFGNPTFHAVVHCATSNQNWITQNSTALSKLKRTIEI